MRIRDIRKNNKILGKNTGFHLGRDDVEVLGVAGLVFKKDGRGHWAHVVRAEDPAIDEVGFVVDSDSTHHFVTQDSEIFVVSGHSWPPNVNTHIPTYQAGMYPGESEAILEAVKEWSDNKHADT